MSIKGEELKRKFDDQWDWLTKQAALHPKTAIFISLAVGGVVGYFVHALLF